MGNCGKCANEEQKRKQKTNEKYENTSQGLDNSAYKNKFQNKNKMKNNQKKQKKNNKDMTYKDQKNYKPSSGYDINEGKNIYAYNQNELQNENKIQNTPKADTNYPDFDMASPPILEHNTNEVVNNEKDLKRFDENSQIMMKESTTGDWDQKEKDMKNFENSINKGKKQIIKREPTEPTMYDAIFKCESINTLFKKGWNYFLTEKFDKRIKNKEYRICPMCFLGETNKGKTFIINLLTNKNLKSGSEYKTEGISCKFSDFEYSNNEINDSDEPEKFLLFDSAGRSEPLLIEPEEKLSIKDDLKRIVETNYRDLKVSEEFLKNVLINNSQIIIFVVNQLTLSEQIFLYELKNQQNFDQLFIIHNLFNFEKKEDLEDYIDNTIVRSIYFDMSKDYFPMDPKYENNNNLPYYFVEYQDNNGEQSLINHLILGNIETKDPWIDNLNEETIKLLKKLMQTCVADSKLEIKEILEKQLQEEAKIDKETKLEDIPDENEIINETKVEDLSKEFQTKGIFKLFKEDNEPGVNQKDNDDKNVNNFKGYDESKGFSVMGYIPDYIFYKNNQNTEFVIEVECSGIEDKDFSIKARESKGKVHFNILGKKIFPKELNMKDKPFSIYFSVNVEKEGIEIETGEEIDKKKPIYQKGIYKKIFKMSKNEQNDMQ
jgi:hypothetical protein